MKILVMGAAGQLGRIVADRWSSDHEIVPLTRSDLDVTDPRAVRECVLAVRPSAIINCAAYNKVDAAEDEAASALEVNAFAVRSLGMAAEEVGAVLVHYSTDFVFDGEASRPYTEEDPANPRSVYAASKLLGEWFARDVPRAFVLRVESLFGGRAAKSSVDRIIDAIVEGREARVFADRTVSPSYVTDVAAVTRALVERGEPGLYHCVNSGYATWYELAQEIARQLGRAARLTAVSVKDVALPAARPRFAALDNGKLARAGFLMPSWQDALARYLRTRE